MMKCGAGLLGRWMKLWTMESVSTRFCVLRVVVVILARQGSNINQTHMKYNTAVFQSSISSSPSSPEAESSSPRYTHSSSPLPLSPSSSCRTLSGLISAPAAIAAIFVASRADVKVTSPPRACIAQLLRRQRTGAPAIAADQVLLVVVASINELVKLAMTPHALDAHLILCCCQLGSRIRCPPPRRNRGR